MNRMIPLIALLAAFPPMATDMYLPATPLLQELWQVPMSTINLTLVLFFISFSSFLLFYGPISDRVGRRPVLIFGISLYMLSSVSCWFADSIHMLILLRIFQGAGAAAAAALAMAVCKDLFDGKEREQMLAYVVSIVAIAPMLAPILGGVILTHFSWNWIFVVQGILALPALIAVIRMEEPLKEKNGAGVVEMGRRYLRLIRYFPFVHSNAIMALGILPMFAYIAGSSDIYINGFGVSEQVYGFYFGGNAFAFMCGSLLCSRLVRHIDSKKIMMAAFFNMACGGILMAFFGHNGPIVTGITMFIITLHIGMARPLTNNMALELAEQDAGAASSILVFTYFLLGAGAMAFISQDWPDKIRILAGVGISSGVTAAILLLWFQIRERRTSLAASV